MFNLIKPKFWSTRGLVNFLFLPFSWLYSAIVICKYLISHPPKVDAPVICVGNVTAGGTGKTPVAMAIAKHFLDKGLKVAFLTRGYGGTLSNNNHVTRVNHHSPPEVGDEAIILAKIAPTYIGANRYLSAQQAIIEGANLLIMDDGLQNYTLHKDFSILVIDKEYGLGNQLTIPAGPLREPLFLMHKKADCIITTGEGAFANTLPLPSFHASLNVIEADIISNNSYIILCGLGNPNKFFNLLHTFSIAVYKKYIFSDHHQYLTSELLPIIEEAKKLSIKIITTEKDYVKIPLELRTYFIVIKISYQLPTELYSFLTSSLKTHYSEQ